jgi:enoyl-CoA hydratase
MDRAQTPEAGVDTAVDVHADGPALWLRINRPEALNSISLEVIEQLQAGLDRAAADTTIKAVVLTATGRAFCAGADLKAADEAGGSGNEFRWLLGVLLNRIEAFPKPVIAAVNGLALAGGLELILACDIVIAAQSARIGDGHAKYGLLPGGGASVRLPRLIGRNRALQMFFTGDLYDAAVLERWGLVNAVVRDDALIEEVTKLTDRFADKSPLGLARMKRLVQETAQQPATTGLSLELLYSALHETSHDMAEGMSAFVEKRQPEFNGS